MNLDELKSVWKEYDRKIESTQALNEKLISSMITERSTSRFEKVRVHYLLGTLWMVICLSFGVLILFSNPFDYKYTIQYIPMALFCVCLAILIGGILSAYSKLRSIKIDQSTLSASLRQIIDVYEKPKKFLNYTVVAFLITQVFLFPLSFLPKGIERMGLWLALGERLIPISISALLLFIAYKFGAFKERNAEKFKKDLTELEELKAMALELRKN
jgi:hypothetical protein